MIRDKRLSSVQRIINGLETLDRNDGQMLMTNLFIVTCTV